MAQTPAETSRLGVVTGTNVYVRSGPGNSYPCTKLSYPAKVRVGGQWQGRLKIVPPKGAYYYISARYVRKAGEADTVRTPTTMDANAVAVRPRPTTHPTGAEAPPESATPEELAAFKAAEEALRAEYGPDRTIYFIGHWGWQWNRTRGFQAIGGRRLARIGCRYRRAPGEGLFQRDRGQSHCPSSRHCRRRRAGTDYGRGH